MKNILFTLLICLLSGSVNATSFTIYGQVDGLMVGDTLSFERIGLPGFKLDFAFDAVVEQPSTFTYRGSHDEIGFYMMTYKPRSGVVVSSDKRGLLLLIKGGTTHLIGSTNSIYYCQLKGGLYENEMLQHVLDLENTLGKKRSELLRLMDEARGQGDGEKAKEYGDKFNSFHSDNREEIKRLSSLKEEFYASFPSSEHTLIDALQDVDSAPFEVSLSKYENMDSEAQNSFFGKVLKQEIDKIAVLVPGNKAPDFHLTSLDGKEITLADCAGSYALIYHWGLCPGSFTIEKQVVDLYNTYKDHLIVIGITDKIQDIQGFYESIGPGDKFGDLELKPTLASMLEHPWFDAEKTGDNSRIDTDYAFAGLPYFIFISPDGKIIARDFHAAFNKAKKTMEMEFGAR